MPRRAVQPIAAEQGALSETIANKTAAALDRASRAHATALVVVVATMPSSASVTACHHKQQRPPSHNHQVITNDVCSET